MSTRWRAAVALVLAFFLAGCGARTDVTITVRSPASADVTVAVEFTGEAAQTLRTSPATVADLQAVFTDRTGQEGVVKDDGTTFAVVADVSYQDLAGAADVLGVAQVVLSGAGEAVTATVELTAAPALLEAMSQAVAGQPDAAALTATMAATTTLSVNVRFPGGLSGTPTLVGVSSGALNQGPEQVTVVRTLADAGPGALTVTGNPTAPPNWLLIAAIGLALTLAGAVWWAKTADRRERY